MRQLLSGRYEHDASVAACLLAANITEPPADYPRGGERSVYYQAAWDGARSRFSGNLNPDDGEVATAAGWGFDAGWAAADRYLTKPHAAT